MDRYLEVLRDTETSGTKETILNAAETVFADKGFHGATVREIFKLADVNSGLMSYYFSSKEELYRQCLTRRLDHLNRMFAIAVEDLLKNTNGNPSPKDICFTRIYFFLSLVTKEELGLRNYIKLLGQTTSVYEDYDFEEIMEAFRPILETTIDLLQQALPFADREKLRSNFYYFEACEITMIRGDEFRRLRFGDISDEESLVAVSEKMAQFFSRGIMLF